jgi:redox-regulated HSP33 family molecular chaperone
MALEFVCPRSLRTIRTGWERDEFKDMHENDELSVDCPFCNEIHPFRMSEAKPPAMAED